MGVHGLLSFVIHFDRPMINESYGTQQESIDSDFMTALALPDRSSPLIVMEWCVTLPRGSRSLHRPPCQMMPSAVDAHVMRSISL
ncbi:hypothetical protein D3C71_1713900 [compost metagenome]